MKKEENIENRIRIFCIYFKKKKYESMAGKHLSDIAKIGSTEKFYSSDSLHGLYENFKQISDSI